MVTGITFERSSFFNKASLSESEKTACNGKSSAQLVNRLHLKLGALGVHDTNPKDDRLAIWS